MAPDDETNDERDAPSELLERVASSFARRGWTFRRIDDPPAVELTHDTVPVPWKSYAEADHGDTMLLYVSLCPEVVPPTQRAAVAEYLTRVNFNLRLGAFEMNWETGEVRFKTGIDLHGAPLTAELLQGVIQPNHQAMALYLPNLLNVLHGEQAPREAYVEAAAEDR